jgi:ribonucleoside-diphosphate reductase alpha chain
MGDLITGALDALAMSMSIGLQHGVPLELFTSKLRGLHGFGPHGFTGDAEYVSCTSLFDLVAQYLTKTFPNGRYLNPHTVGREPPKEG